eukprot:317592-Prorocentrum_minimum.AAC.1
MLAGKRSTTESTLAVGQLWASGKMYVDATLVNVTMGSIPRDKWANVHLEAGRNFAGIINVMSRASEGGTKGWLSEVRIICRDSMSYRKARLNLAYAIGETRYYAQQSHVSLWDRALSQDVITSIVTEYWYTYPEGSGLLGYFATEEGTGARLKDVSRGAASTLVIVILMRVPSPSPDNTFRKPRASSELTVNTITSR